MYGCCEYDDEMFGVGTLGARWEGGDERTFDPFQLLKLRFKFMAEVIYAADNDAVLCACDETKPAIV
jgi:hypothetical protein